MAGAQNGVARRGEEDAGVGVDGRSGEDGYAGREEKRTGVEEQHVGIVEK